MHYMHGKGYFHRDLKLENLLVSRSLIKIGDMGSAKEITSSRPFTDYVTMCCVPGSPTTATWLGGLALAGGMNYRFPQLLGVNLSLLMSSASGNAISLIKSLCSWDPSKRPIASEALTHPFFHACDNIIPPSPCLRPSVGRTIIGEEFEQKNVGVIGVNHQVSMAINYAWINDCRRIWFDSDSSYVVQFLSTRFDQVPWFVRQF
ncbi:hypothetical protein Ddye_011726 [Dipteronia dyeriana]|uniref:Protein kinase domain-containing protein n=1 Tax=Dipteronia dyeriana TaxID=168575 RepID=A0AAD9X308_9ROSI|nr:hypothetical protein Ddye_011726 [Dipteronia dyeriana]